METKTEINLPEYLTHKNISSERGHEFITLPVKKPFHKSFFNELALLQALLKKVGIELCAFEYAESDTLLLTFRIDLTTYNRKTTRKAGRKISYNKVQERGYSPCTIGELRERLKAKPQKTTLAAELGCPRITLYRIIKNLDAEDWYEGDDYLQTRSIWNYTY